MSAEDTLQEARDAAMKAVGHNRDAQDAVRAAFTTYDGVITDLEEQLEEAEREAEDERSTEAIHAFCDAVERPVGKLSFVVPKTAEVDRAILRLHDAIGRRL